jgi:hypothetical protein
MHVRGVYIPKFIMLELTKLVICVRKSSVSLGQGWGTVSVTVGVIHTLK